MWAHVQDKAELQHRRLPDAPVASDETQEEVSELDSFLEP